VRPHDHQPVDFGAVGGVEVSKGFDLAPHETDFGTKDPSFEAVLRDLPFLWVENGYKHG
jgi:hypothetical protein